MNKTMRGRPRLDITLEEMVDAVRRHRNITKAALELGCSPGHVHGRLRRAKVSLREVLLG